LVSAAAVVFVVVVILILEEDGDVQLKSDQRYCAHLSITDRQTFTKLLNRLLVLSLWW